MDMQAALESVVHNYYTYQYLCILVGWERHARAGVGHGWIENHLTYHFCNYIIICITITKTFSLLLLYLLNMRRTVPLSMKNDDCW